MKTYKCMFCNKENKWGSSKFNKFCPGLCHAQYKWENETKPRIERGECTHYSSKTLKKYLIETRGNICSCCKLVNSWCDKPLTLQLDHIDGNSDNNYLTNLRLLCPNCHSQTPNFGSKGKGSRYKKITKRNTYLQEYKNAQLV